MFEKGDQVVLSNGDICTIVECRMEFMMYKKNMTSLYGYQYQMQ